MSAHALAASAFWMLWRPRSELMPARSARCRALAGPGRAGNERGSLGVPTCATRTAAETRSTPASIGEPQSLDGIPAPVVILADDGAARFLDQARLEGRVVLHRAVAVEVIGRDVEQHADTGRERGGQLDLNDDISMT